jgi:hypothetical protein
LRNTDMIRAPDGGSGRRPAALLRNSENLMSDN